MAADTTFSLQQALAAQRDMRDALGLSEERFPLPAFIGMISDEIDQLRARGRSDEEISRMIETSTGRTFAAADIDRHYAPPERRHPV